jgi:Eukaryotic aspartyl protease
LGVGYQSNEVQVQREGEASYANLPIALVNQKFIESPAYSLWLNDLDASTGQILFGGVNTDKYHGSLSTLPIQKSTGESTPTEFIITLTAVGLTDSTGNSQNITSDNTAIPVLLDSGSSLTYLPNSVVQTLYNQVSASYDSQSETAFVDCSLGQSNGTLDFTFSGVSISIAMNELVLDAGENSDGSALTDSSGNAICIFGVSPAGDSSDVLGDTFLRSAYVVYDLGNNEISLAKTNFNATEDSIQAIGTGSSAVPDATGVTNPVTAAATGTGNGRLGASSTSTAKSGAVPNQKAPTGIFYGMLVAGMSVFAGMLML